MAIYTFDSAATLNLEGDGGNLVFSSLRAQPAFANVSEFCKLHVAVGSPVNKYDLLVRTVFDFNTSSLASILLASNEIIKAVTLSTRLGASSNGLSLSDHDAGVGILESTIKTTNNTLNKFLLANISFTTIANNFNYSEISVDGTIITFNLNNASISK
jgi:hypothetical protein